MNLEILTGLGKVVIIIIIIIIIIIRTQSQYMRRVQACVLGAYFLISQ